MEQRKLFPDLAESEANPPATGSKDLRVVRPVRNQIQMVMEDLDATLPQDHPARAIWSASGGWSGWTLVAFMRLSSRFREALQQVTLLGLWVYGTVEGVGGSWPSFARSIRLRRAGCAEECQ